MPKGGEWQQEVDRLLILKRLLYAPGAWPLVPRTSWAPNHGESGLGGWEKSQGRTVCGRSSLWGDTGPGGQMKALERFCLERTEVGGADGQ